MRLDLVYYVPRNRAINLAQVAPGGALGDAGILDRRSRLGLGTSIVEFNEANIFEGGGIGSFAPIHFYWAPYLKPFNFGTIQSASIIFFSISFSLWGATDFENFTFSGKKYLNVQANYQPGPLLGLKLGCLYAKGKRYNENIDTSAIILRGGLELRIGGWFSSYKEVQGRPAEMRILQVNNFVIKLKKEILAEYSDNAGYNEILDRLNNFQNNILNLQLRKREKIIKNATTLGACVPAAVVTGLFGYQMAQYQNEQYNTEGQCLACLFYMLVAPGVTTIGYTTGYSLSYVYSNFPLSQADIAILDGIIKDYNNLKNKE